MYFNIHKYKVFNRIYSADVAYHKQEQNISKLWLTFLGLDLIIWHGLQRKAKETHCWFTADSACYKEMESSHALFNKVLSFTKILKQVCQRKNPREVYFGRIFEPFCITFYVNVFNVSNIYPSVVVATPSLDCDCAMN